MSKPLFSIESNPYLRAMAEAEDEDSYSILGKKVKKKSAKDILAQLSQMGDEDEEEEFSSMGSSAKGKAAKKPAYDPNDIYGGFFSMYGGKRVRGGLLGE